MRGRRAARSCAPATSFTPPTQREDIMGINTPKTNRTDETTAEQTLINGVNKHATALPVMAIAGATLTTTQIVATLQSRIDSAKSVLIAKANWQAAIVADQVHRNQTKTCVAGLRQALLAAFTGQIDTLADFGLTPRKVFVATPEERIA